MSTIFNIYTFLIFQQNTQYEIANYFYRYMLLMPKLLINLCQVLNSAISQITNKHTLMRFLRIINVYGETYRTACQKSKLH